MPMDPPSVLIVDDDDDIRANLADILEDMGYVTRTAADGTEAIRLVRENRHDVALVDYKMPGMDGLTLYHSIRQIRPEMATFLVTGFAEAGVTEAALGAGIVHVIDKPVDVPLILGRIAAVLNRTRVLVVDDDIDFTDGLWELLHQRGFRVAVAHDEAGAVRYLESSTCDVVLLDVVIGNGDPAKIMKSLFEKQADTHVLLVTGLDLGDATVSKLLQDGAHGVCRKPVGFEDLLGKLALAAK